MPNVLKVIEVLAESDQGWEDAAQKAVDKAKQSLHGIRSIYIENFEAKVEDGRITSYRINGKVTFQLD
jgi:flavin-binding protein dodecin